MGGEWSASRSSCLYIWEKGCSRAHWIQKWVGPRGETEAVVNRKDPISASDGNRTPIVQHLPCFRSESSRNFSQFSSLYFNFLDAILTSTGPS